MRFCNCPLGTLLDRFGARLLLSVALALVTAGSLIFAGATTIETAYTGRVLIGAGSASGFIATLALVAKWFPPQKFAFLTGATMFLAMICGVGGQAPLAAAVEAFGWRATMFWAGIFGRGVDGGRCRDRPQCSTRHARGTGHSSKRADFVPHRPDANLEDAPGMAGCACCHVNERADAGLWRAFGGSVHDRSLRGAAGGGCADGIAHTSGMGRSSTVLRLGCQTGSVSAKSSSLRLLCGSFCLLLHIGGPAASAALGHVYLQPGSGRLRCGHGGGRLPSPGRSRPPPFMDPQPVW